MIGEVIVQGVLEVLVLYVVVQIVIESRVINDVYVDMLMNLRKRFSEGVMSLGVNSMSRVKVF